MTPKCSVLIGENLVLLSTTKPLSKTNCKDDAIKEKNDLRAEVTPHAVLGLTGYTSDDCKKKLDVGTSVGLVQSLVFWVFNVIDIDDGGVCLYW